MNNEFIKLHITFEMKKLLTILSLILIKFAFGQAPANDNCSTPQVITIPSSGNICINSTNVNATSDLTLFNCQTTGSNDHDVWFTFIATGSQNTVVVTPNGGTPAHQIAVSISNTNCASGAYNVCNASATNAGAATVTYTYTPGAQILVNIATNGTDGTFSVCITSITPPPAPGSSCATATPLCNLNSFTVSPLPANNNGLQPPCFLVSLQRPMFYQFTVGATGTCAWLATPLGAVEYDWAMYNITAGCPGTLTACNYHYAFGVGAPIGMSPASATACPISSVGGNVNREICPSVTVVAGQTYLLVIDGFSASTTGFNFNWTGSTFQMAPTANFTVTPSTSCGSETATFTNTSVPTGNTYAWTFGDGTTSVVASPPAHSYPTPGTYLISLTAQTAAGCTSTGSGSVLVKPIPTMTAPSNVTVCPAAVVPADAFVSSPTGATFAWTNSNTAIGLAANGAGNRPAFTATNATASAITSTITITPTLNGCVGTLVTYTITVNPLPVVTVNSPTICAGQGATLTANTATSFTWSAGATSTGVNTATASPATTTTYTVTGSTLGCTSTAVSTVTVNPLPLVTVDSPTICAGQTATMTASNATSFTWSAGTTSTGVTTATALPVTTTTYTVTGSTLGCTATAVSTVTVNPLPVVSVDSPTICIGQTATITATGATSYTWSAGPTSSGVTTATVTPAATTTYTVTGSTLGCIATAVSTVTANSLPIVLVNSPTVCPTATATLTATGAASYTWSAGATSTGVNTATATPATNTTYTVTGSTLGCIGTAVSTVTVSNILALTVNSPTICAGQTANITASGATSYTWTAGATSSGVNTATASPVATTSYTVTGTDLGCTGTAVSTVTVNPLPLVAVTSPTICVGQTATMTASGATTYTWSVGATSTGITTADASPTLSTLYTVIGTTLGCIDSAVSNVTVNSLPVVIVNSPFVCAGQTANLTASGATSYTWSAGATSSGVNSATVTAATTSTYTVTGTSLGCSSTTVSTVTVNPLPIATVSGGGAVCVGITTPSINISLTGTGPWNITYTDGTNNTSVTATFTPYTITAPSVGTYSVTLISNANCTGSSSGTATVAFSPTPSTAFTATPISGCAPLCVTFTDATTPAGTIVNWNWSFGDGGSNTSQNPQHCYTSPGTYSVTLIATSGNNCSATATVANYIKVTAPPVASFSAPPTTSVLDPTVQFSDYSTGATSWSWNFGDPNSVSDTSNAQNPSYVYPQAGTSCVLLAVNNGLCIDSSTVCIIIEPEFTFYIPNAFSPDGDGVNDEFYGKGENIINFDMSIYDRWGMLIFHTQDINKHWDGKGIGSGTIVQQDVYVYSINLTDIFTKEHKYLGTVTVVR